MTFSFDEKHGAARKQKVHDADAERTVASNRSKKIFQKKTFIFFCC